LLFFSQRTSAYFLDYWYITVIDVTSIFSENETSLLKMCVDERRK